MFSWFTEDATFPLITGFFLVVTLLGLAAYSREKIILYGALAVTAMCVLTLITETLIVTNKERVQETLYNIEKSIRNNDFATTFTYIANEDTIGDAKNHTDGLVCEQCSIISLDNIEVDHYAQPRTAVADFPVYGRVNIFPSAFTVRVVLDMEEDATGNWKIVDYQLIDPRTGKVERTSKSP
jgi:hypothetical protein